jgi:hypothetical protein
VRDESMGSREPAVRYTTLDDRSVSIVKRAMPTIRELERFRGRDVILFDSEAGYIVARADDVIRAITDKIRAEINREVMAVLFGSAGQDRAEEVRQGCEEITGEDKRPGYEVFLRIWSNTFVNPRLYTYGGLLTS